MGIGAIGKRWSREGKGVGNGEGECSVSSQATISSRKSPVVRSAAAARYQHEEGAGLRRVVGGTHWQPIVLHHFIKLLVNFFVFLFSAGGEGEGLLGVWALRVPVLFLVQSLRSPNKRREGRQGERKRERERKREESREKREKKKRKGRLDKVTKMWLYSRRSAWRGCPGPRSCGHLAGFGRWSRRRRARGCCNR